MITYSTLPFFVSVLVAVAFAIYVYIMLKLRQPAKEEYVCPSCKETLKLQTTMKPLEITYRCANPDCPLSRSKQKSRDGEKNQGESD